MDPMTEVPKSAERGAAAFYRVEGVLLRRPSLAAAAYMAANAQGLGERLARLSNVALAAPLTLAGELNVGSLATRMTWMGVRGLSEDRLAVLADEYFESFVESSLSEVGLDLVARSKRHGHRIVLISDQLDLIVGRLKERLGAADLICNRLEFQRGRATGRLLDPIVGGNLAGQWARSYAEEHGIDLEKSTAYGAQAADGLLLSAIGKPCAVDPDRQLRRMANDHAWPVVDR